MAGFVEESLKPKGYQQIVSATLAAATALTVPAAATNSTAARLALIIVEGAAVRWRDDGTDPTAAVGMLMQAGENIWYNGDIHTIKFIRTIAGSIINVSYY